VQFALIGDHPDTLLALYVASIEILAIEEHLPAPGIGTLVRGDTVRYRHQHTEQ
jgi:hypothetical protein